MAARGDGGSRARVGRSVGNGREGAFAWGSLTASAVITGSSPSRCDLRAGVAVRLWNEGVFVSAVVGQAITITSALS